MLQIRRSGLIVNTSKQKVIKSWKTGFFGHF